MSPHFPPSQSLPGTKSTIRRVADSAPMVMWMLDAKNFCTYINPSTAALFRKDEKIDISAWLEFMHPDDMPRVLPALRAAMEDRREYQIRYRILRSDGSVRWMMGTGTPRFGCGGEFLGYNGSEIDVSDHHAALEDISKSEATHRLLTENSSDVITHHDAAGIVMHISASVGPILGFEPAELIGKSAYDHIHPEDTALVIDEVQRQLATGDEGRMVELRKLHRQGHYVWMATKMRTLTDPVTRECTGVISVCRDVSFERQAREELKKREERFRSLTTLSSDWYWETDEAGRFTFISEGAEKIFGAPVDYFLQKTRADLARDASEPGLRLYLEKLASRQPFRDLRYGGFAPGDGRVRYVSISGEPVFDGGIFRGYRGIGRNVTREIEVAERLVQLANENKALVENSLDIIALLDADGHFLRINGALTEILGYQPDEWLGRPYADFLHADELQDTRAVDAGLRTGKNTIHDYETRWIRKDGSIAYLSLSARWAEDKAALYVTARDVTARKQAERRLEHLATHDTLTGLPNRAFLNTHVQQMLESTPHSQGVAIFFIDLDRFKEVNDSFGHEPGDMLLCEVGRRLQHRLRPGDFIARLGGDEFVVAAPCSAGRESAEAIARKLLATLGAPVQVAGQEVFVGASIGISMFPDHGQTKELLFQCADTAMYRAKAAGRNGYRFFAPEMSVEAKTRMKLELSLRHALERRELSLHYQPRIDLKTMSIVGMEALARWHHPELGDVPPMQFIPIAEENGLIETIGHWVLEEACTQAQRLLGKFGRQLRISVNLSARQLKSRSIVEQVRGVLDRTGIPPQLLELELTESALIDDIAHSAGVLKQLKCLGIQLAVDDFGTGYSGLAYLRRFPLDVLKLDRSFVMHQDEDENSSEFIKAFVDMAHALKMAVVAEGVETAETLQFLRNASCDEAQGYFLARPLTLEAFEAYLSRLPAAQRHAG
ncbi:EAL domain-containing protein [Noviherbaspirillum sp. CPCC 100848]|uniref:EAL domain-containing protein n=1 Tax=Noviherbaspirillum album TaxID=3080276 RepID=A0ABU6JEM6_9BURK|nr:EAL domain-containing protein [Noviherbaspirillum sp. CPCC 100848]MEC4721662.1 EAL domain-containing protein [Noviherbaspirillum sp. CPCC 100848]